MTAFAIDTRTAGVGTTSRPRRPRSVCTFPTTPVIAARPTQVVPGRGRNHAVHACSVVVPRAEVSVWRLTRRGMVLAVGSVYGISALSLYTIVSHFIQISG